MKWTVRAETDETIEAHESEAGKIEKNSSGWDAWVYLPTQQGKKQYKVGECYKTALSARAAVIRQYNKHKPLD